MKTIISRVLASTAIAFAAAGAQAEVIVSDSTYRNFDKSSGYVSFKVDTHGLIGDLNVAIEFSKCDNPYLGAGGTSCESDDTPF